MADDEEDYSPKHYRLEGTKVVQCANFEEWLEFMKELSRMNGNDHAEWEKRYVVARTRLHDERFLVSTVFLGIDMRFGPGEPQLFETMVFDEAIEPGQSARYYDQYMERYSTWTEAEQGHQKIVDQIKADLPLILVAGEIDDEK